MPKFRDVGRRRCGLHAELGQKLVIVEFVGGAGRGRLRARQKPLMIEGLKQGAGGGQLAKPVEAHGV